MSRNSSRPRSSQAGLKRPPRPPPPPHTDTSLNSPLIGQRSRSLTTLQQTVIMQPRMAQLETLEAKMANIEVSLSSNSNNRIRNKKNGPIFRSNKEGEMEMLRKSLREKDENNINRSMKLIMPGLKLKESFNNLETFNEKEKNQILTALSTLKSEVDSKKLAIKNLKMALDRLDVSDNIDVRIRQAELEFQLGREELNLLTLLEEARGLQACLDDAERRFSSPDAHTLYRCVKNLGVPIRLLTVELEFDPRNPKFGAGPREKQAGLWVDWALQDTGIKEGDRLVEVNGKIVLDKSRDDLQRLLSAAPDPAQIVLLRRLTVEDNKNHSFSSSDSFEEITSLKSELGVVRERAEETQRIKDGLVADNIRLTHRISYLEEQVSELLIKQQKREERPDDDVVPYKSIQKPNVTSININAPPGTVVSQTPAQSPTIQVFQKGHLTALVNLNEERSKSSLSSSGHKNHHHHNHHKHNQNKNKGYGEEMISVRNFSYGNNNPEKRDDYLLSNGKDKRGSNNKVNYVKKLDGDNTSTSLNDYSANEESESLNGKEKSRPNSTTTVYEKYDMKINNGLRNSIAEESYRKATKIVEDLVYHKRNGHNVKNCEKIERVSADILRHFNSRKSASVVDFINQRNNERNFKSVEELDALSSYNSLTPTNTNTNGRSIDSRSVKSLDFDSDCTSVKSTISNSVNGKYNGYTSEPIDANVLRLRWGEKGIRPTPPKKPVRLSLHKAQSLQYVDTPLSGFDPRKPMKRNYKGETHQNCDQENNNDSSLITTSTTRTSYRINA